MIYSMTAFGQACADVNYAKLNFELRSINSRFLDLNIRLPDEIRNTEESIRKLLKSNLIRGKIDVRVSYIYKTDSRFQSIDSNWLEYISEQLKIARKIIPDTAPPKFFDLFNTLTQYYPDKKEIQLLEMTCIKIGKEALEQLKRNRCREGKQLAQIILSYGIQMKEIINRINVKIPEILSNHHEKIVKKLQETMKAAFPGNFYYISNTEFSERLAQEVNFYTIRVDIAEEVTRLNSHLEELLDLLDISNKKDSFHYTYNGLGKKLDFLFQEMNRETNTLGSKVADLNVTRAAMDLKLLIEKMREQAQNIE